jgi:DNA polymerase-3 subunit epsilon
LCKRFKISLADREKHGALVDARLLAAVYIELHGGKERRLDLTQAKAAAPSSAAIEQATYGPRPRPLGARSTEAERDLHAAFVRQTLKDKALWRGFGIDPA